MSEDVPTPASPPGSPTEPGRESPPSMPPGRSFAARTFGALSHPLFRRVFIGITVSTAGSWLYQAAVAFLVQDRFGDARLTGLVATVQFVPAIIFGAYGGVLADRHDRRTLMQVLLSVEFALTAGLAVFLWLDAATLLVFYAITFGLGVAFAMRGPAQFALVPTLVPSRDLPSAISLNGIQFNLGRVLGPIVAGLLLELVGAASTIAVNAGTYLVFLFTVSLVPKRERREPKDGERRSALGDLREAFAYIGRRPWLVGVFVTIVCMGTFAAQIITLLATYATEDLGLGAGGFGLLLAAIGVGGVIGALFSTSAVEGWPRHLLGPLILTGTGIALIVLSFLDKVAAVWLCLVFVGFCYIGGRITLNTVTQTGIDDAMRGRISALWLTVFTGTFALSAPIWGLLARNNDTATTYLLGGILCLIAAAVMLAAVSWFRRDRESN